MEYRDCYEHGRDVRRRRRFNQPIGAGTRPGHQHGRHVLRRWRVQPTDRQLEHVCGDHMSGMFRGAGASTNRSATGTRRPSRTWASCSVAPQVQPTDRQLEHRTGVEHEPHVPWRLGFNQPIGTWKTGVVTTCSACSGASAVQPADRDLEHRTGHGHELRCSGTPPVQPADRQLEHGCGHGHGRHVPAASGSTSRSAHGIPLRSKT